MMWRDQIEARTNAANMTAVWKQVWKMQELLQAPTARDRLLLHLMSLMRRGRSGCCWLLYDDSNLEMALNN